MDGDHGSPTLIEVAALTKRYGEQFALTDVTFDVRAGEVLGIIGPNGAGKTTLLESIAGLLSADSGDVLWQGRPLPLARRRNNLFYLPDGLRRINMSRGCCPFSQASIADREPNWRIRLNNSGSDRCCKSASKPCRKAMPAGSSWRSACSRRSRC
jgi:energy-coupling factor transporter ATP-binding protein EcfA2